MKTKPMLYKSTDKHLNPRLADEVAGVRGALSQAAERVPIPRRFEVVDHPDRPAVIIVDTVTGRSVEMGLCDYYGARVLLATLFPDGGAT